MMGACIYTRITTTQKSLNHLKLKYKMITVIEEN